MTDMLLAAIDRARDERNSLSDSGQEPPVGPEVSNSVTENWMRLKQLDDGARQLSNNRMVAVRGGAAALPYDMLRTRIFQQAKSNGWRRIGIVSPTANCGKTTAAANLAFAFARQTDIRTLVLDLDLRRPRLGRMLGQAVRGNIEDAVAGRSDVADIGLRIGRNVALALNAQPVSSASEMLQSDLLRQWLAGVEAAFEPDILLFDLPPMMATDDNFGFLGKLDCVLLVAAAEETTTEQIDATLRQLNDLTSVLGIVLTKCRHTGGAYGYDDRYYGD